MPVKIARSFQTRETSGGSETQIPGGAAWAPGTEGGPTCGDAWSQGTQHPSERTVPPGTLPCGWREPGGSRRCAPRSWVTSGSGRCQQRGGAVGGVVPITGVPARLASSSRAVCTLTHRPLLTVVGRGREPWTVAAPDPRVPHASQPCPVAGGDSGPHGRGGPGSSPPRSWSPCPRVPPPPLPVFISFFTAFAQLPRELFLSGTFFPPVSWGWEKPGCCEGTRVVRP